MNFTYALGWTLLHSLWQGLILAVLVIIALRLVPSRYSSARYLVSTAALGLMLVAGICTFATLLTQAGSQAPEVSQPLRLTAVNTEVWLAAQHAPAEQPASVLDRFYTFIQSQLQFISLAWVVGVIFFSLRIAGGFWYLSRIRGNAMPVDAAWAERLRLLCIRMGISGEVSLAESAAVQSPFVIGYFKPLILLPMGMISGLSTAQLETILLHELSHIRRADYLVNIVQSFIEAIFFFNPFVWIVSSMVRTEREHCCDDAVVRHGHALTYAQALATVEALRLDRTNLAMSLANDKNQLLKRIKRIMERSVQHYSVKERIVPVILLVVGLACASWMTLSPEQRKRSDGPTAISMVAADTTKPGKTYSSHTITRYDADGKPQEQVIERFEDEDGRHKITIHKDFDFDIEAPEFDEFDMPIAIQVPAFDFHMEPLAPMPAMEPFEPMEPLDIHIAPMPPMMVWNSDDTLKPGVHTFHYNAVSPEDLASFSNEFQARFKDQFADFYKDHGKEMESMMQEMANEFQRNAEEFAHQAEEYSRHAGEFAARQDDLTIKFSYDTHDLAKQKQDLAERKQDLAEKRRDLAEKQRENNDRYREQAAKVKAQNDEQVRVMKNNMVKFKAALKPELVKDGYMTEDETIKSMNWNNTGDITINGKKIKDSDRAKYDGIHDKFFKKDGVIVFED